MRENYSRDFRELFASSRLERIFAGVEKHVRHIYDQAARGLPCLQNRIQLLAKLLAKLRFLLLRSQPILFGLLSRVASPGCFCFGSLLLRSGRIASPFGVGFFLGNSFRVCLSLSPGLFPSKTSAFRFCSGLLSVCRGLSLGLFRCDTCTFRFRSRALCLGLGLSPGLLRCDPRRFRLLCLFCRLSFAFGRRSFLIGYAFVLHFLHGEQTRVLGLLRGIARVLRNSFLTDFSAQPLLGIQKALLGLVQDIRRIAVGASPARNTHGVARLIKLQRSLSAKR